MEPKVNGWNFNFVQILRVSLMEKLIPVTNHEFA
jgi:hypothetical protein